MHCSTRLIIEAYDELGETSNQRGRVPTRDDLAGRYAAICHAVRDWACAHPHEYALIYGSPVPGYAAPDDTIDPAVRVARVFLPLAADIDPAGIGAPLSIGRSTQRCSNTSPRSARPANSTSRPTSSPSV